MYRYQDAIDDFRVGRMFSPAGGSVPPSASDLQKSKLENCFLLPVADLQSQRLETMSKSLFRAFDPGELVVKFEGSGIFGRTLLLQTRLLIMLQVIQYRIYFIADIFADSLQRGDEFESSTKGGAGDDDA
jgi:hypothetical protein